MHALLRQMYRKDLLCLRVSHEYNCNSNINSLVEGRSCWDYDVIRFYCISLLFRTRRLFTERKLIDRAAGTNRGRPGLEPAGAAYGYMFLESNQRSAVCHLNENYARRPLSTFKLRIKQKLCVLQPDGTK